ncbi:hypothetical protein N752_08350 [Desulforamulus aquiferis]|nr:cache domain-containing protein [Desulforamulus aquiferis]RYD05896.1 hypothetical protein N752_08350 [Desulforamulus aquiferis]
MKLFKEKKLNIGSKLMLIGLIPVVLFIFLNLFLIIPELKKDIFNEKDLQIKELVESGYSILEHYQSLEQNGTLSRQEAQEHAMAAIKKMKYGEDGYFWIDNTDYVVVMHPVSPQLDGTNRYETKDAKGKLLVREFVDGAVKNQAEGYFADFWFPKPGTTEAYPKRGYHKLFAPWNWIISTGIYVDDVDSIINKKLSLS